jgi:hypothetical protein
MDFDPCAAHGSCAADEAAAVQLNRNFGSISKLGGEVMEVMEVMNWEVMNSCSNGSNEVEIGLQNDHAVMKMAHGVMM